MKIMNKYVTWIHYHYDDVIMETIASQITSLTSVYSTVYSGADQSKHQSSASLAFVWGIHRGPVNSPHKWPVTRKMFPFDDVIMYELTTKRNTPTIYRDCNSIWYITREVFLKATMTVKVRYHCTWLYFQDKKCNLLNSNGYTFLYSSSEFCR